MAFLDLILFIVKETEAQRGEITDRKGHSKTVFLEIQFYVLFID